MELLPPKQSEQEVKHELALSYISTNTLDCQADQRIRATTTRTTARKPNVMTTQTEALKSAIEFAEYCLEELDLSHMASNQAKRLVQKSKEALSSPNGEAQPEQEKERCVGCEACIDTACGRDECPKGWPKAAQPEQEPVGQLLEDAFGRGQVMWFNKPKDESMLYTTPPQRTWVELTRGEIESWELPDKPTVAEFAWFVETKVREKNT